MSGESGAATSSSLNNPLWAEIENKTAELKSFAGDLNRTTRNKVGELIGESPAAIDPNEKAKPTCSLGKHILDLDAIMATLQDTHNKISEL
jgi:hypothetical protein